MRWRRAFIPECLLLFLASFVLGPSPTFAMQYTKNSFDEKECEHVLECHTCSMDEKQDIRECGITGKIYTQTCPLDRDVVGDEMNTVTRYVSCSRTKSDEQSLFVRFQMLCLVLGTLSFIWVRRYRVVYASLFEQRKMSTMRRVSDHEAQDDSENGGGGSLEMATREEISPLTGSSNNNNNLEIV